VYALNGWLVGLINELTQCVCLLVYLFVYSQEIEVMQVDTLIPHQQQVQMWNLGPLATYVPKHITISPGTQLHPLLVRLQNRLREVEADATIEEAEVQAAASALLQARLLLKNSENHRPSPEKLVNFIFNLMYLKFSCAVILSTFTKCLQCK
jgi:hypothetical protein